METRKFVRTYMWAFNNGKTSLDVSKKLDVEVKKVYSYANYLRKLGVKLPFLNKEAGRQLSVDDLNSLISKSLEG